MGSTLVQLSRSFKSVSSATPLFHHSTHEPGGSDVLTNLTDLNVAAANKDGAAATPSLRTLGAGALQAAPGTVYLLASTPVPHHQLHEPGGSDPMKVDEAAAVGSLRTLGTGASQAAPGNDSRFTGPSTPAGFAGGDLTGTYPNPTITAAKRALLEGVTNVKDPVYGAIGNGIANDRTAIQNAITDVENAGGGIVYLPPGTYLLGSGSPLQFSRNGTGGVTGTRDWVTVQGSGASTIQLSSAVYRVFDLNRQADGDVFARIAIKNLTIDANNVVPPGTSGQHVLFGNLINGGWATRVNVESIYFENIRGINCTPGTVNSGSTPLTPNRQWISIGSRQNPADSQTRLVDIKAKNINLQGANVGLAVIGSSLTGSQGVNNWQDRISVEDFVWDSTVNTNSAFSSSAACIQLGGLAYGQSCSLNRIFGYNSEDVGIEIDGYMDANISNSFMQDSLNVGYLVRNFHAALNVNAQIARLHNCTSQLSNFNPGVNTSQGTGFAISGNITPNPTFGHAILNNCKFYSSQTNYANLGQAVYAGVGQPYQALTINNFEAVVDNVSVTNTTGVTIYPTLFLISPSTDSVVELRNLKYRIAGSATPTNGVINNRPLYISPTGGARMTLIVDGVYPDVNLPGVISGGNHMKLGEGTGTMDFSINNFKVLSWPTGQDPNPHFISISGTSTMTIPKMSYINNCDFTQCTTSHYSVFWNNANQNQDKVKITNTKWNLIGNASAQIWGTWPPAPIQITPSTQPYTYQNLDAMDENIFVTGGTVTKIEMGRGTAYTDTGLTAGRFLLNVADYLRVTFATPTASPTATPIMTKVAVI